MRRDRTGEPIDTDVDDELADVTPTTTREEAIAAIRAALNTRHTPPEPPNDHNPDT